MEDKELKREFELERVILFSDAVFAIIITIMVLDVKLPEGLRHEKPEVISHAFVELLPKLITYGVSFLLVSAFWIRHLKIFKVLKDYTVPLVVRNLIFLFTISLFPFAVSIISGLSPGNFWNLNAYITIILLSSFVQTVVVAYIIKHKQALCFSPATVEDTLKWKAYKVNYVLFPISLVLLILVNLLHVTELAGYIVVLQIVVIKMRLNKYYPKEKPSQLKMFFTKKRV